MQTTPLRSFPAVPSPSAAESTADPTDFSSILDATGDVASADPARTNGASSADSALARSSDAASAPREETDQSRPDGEWAPPIPEDSESALDDQETPELAVAAASGPTADRAAFDGRPPASTAGAWGTASDRTPGATAASTPTSAVTGATDGATPASPAPPLEPSSASIGNASVGPNRNPDVSTASESIGRLPTEGRLAGVGRPAIASDPVTVAGSPAPVRATGGVAIPADFVAVSPAVAMQAEAGASGARRSGGKTSDAPASGAVGRAAANRAASINEAVAAERSSDGTTSSRVAGVQPGAAASAWIPSATASMQRTAPIDAQGVPMPGAGVAPESLEGGPARTMPGVARGLEALSQQRGGSLVMRLDPPSLGQLKLEMTMQAGRVSVVMTTAAETARGLLNTNLGMLRQALEDRGLAVERLTVETVPRPVESGSSSRSEHRGDGQDARSGQDADARQDAGQGRSRGRREDASQRPEGRDTDPARSEAATFGEALADANGSDR